MKISRAWAMSNHSTFKIKPIAALLEKYNVGKNWADPFCGDSTLCEYRNDLKLSNQCSLEWIKTLPNDLTGVVVDPPYSPRQISEHYKACGRKVTSIDTQNMYAKIYDALLPKLSTGGLIISFGWHSNGAGKVRGFEKLEILLVAHGAAKNDTICTVEQLLKEQPR